ncbi:hypothetical protein SAV31267_033400 [Streptomyces avermitilis]|uniref:Uncharacterized protein n=1 Tax=Streptomyces avermitilis TaxID=33903 RepID=A0A4D4MQV1_STRAX|nr:hypothetical protein SAV31267_033400 [Streptomyces avermitilis]
MAALVGLALWRRRAPNADEPQPLPPAPGLWLGTVALTLVGVVIAGFFALLVPVLALLAWKRHALLVPIAFLALAGAGIAAATGAGSPVSASEGAFGPVAQLLALIGLFAGLVSIPEPVASGGDGTTHRGAASGGDGTTHRGGVPPGAQAPAEPLRTEPLPRRPRGGSLLGKKPGAKPSEEKPGATGAPGAEAASAPGAGPARTPHAEPAGSPQGEPAAGHTVSARGPGRQEPDPPTARPPLRGPGFRDAAPDDDTGKGDTP